MLQLKFTLVVLVVSPLILAAADETDQAVSELFAQHCVDCHSGVAAEGGIDLTELGRKTSQLGASASMPAETTDRWVLVERAIDQGRMPPPSEAELTLADRASFARWFRHRVVLNNGQPHIGVSPLRRLTHAEFINSLEDLLGVSVRSEYNHLHSVHVERGLVDRVLPVEVPGESGFVNDAHGLAEQPLPLLAYMKCIDFALSKVSGSESAMRMLFGSGELPESISEERIRDIVNRFLRRALRGRDSKEHVDRAIAVYLQASQQRSTMSAFKTMLRTILLLPEFYYRMESEKGQSNPYPVSDFELATRLSYFLNASTPDDELLRVAEAGSLSQPEVLDQQVQRLLDSPRRLSLAESFAAQWIGFDGLLDDSDSDERGVPTADRGQYDELLYFFDELFRSDLSLLDIIDSDWAYVSSYTQNTYGADQFGDRVAFPSIHADVLASRRLIGSQRRGLERIYDPPTLRSVRGDRYGGVITSAAVMRLTSAPERTSPVRRGVWILDRIIGQKLESPKNVPSIEQAVQRLANDKPTKLEIIRAHTEAPGCMFCHRDIDPIGFGLENFDPVGRWRTQYGDKQTVHSQGVLPGGKPFSSPKELKRQLLAIYRESIVRNFIRRMLSYAIGRSLKPHDRITEDAIYRSVVENDYRSNVVVREIIRSPQFRCRQDEG